VFNNLNEFHRHSCDILLLTRTQSGNRRLKYDGVNDQLVFCCSEGGGFLKLIGMPFRMLLDENEALKHIMSHRQSAVSMAGLRAIHIVIFLFIL
jgi:hypothetical protein